MKNISLKEIKDKNKIYSLTTEYAVGYKQIDDKIYVINMKVKLIVKYAMKYNDIIYSVIGIDKEYFNNQYEKVVNKSMIDEIVKKEIMQEKEFIFNSFLLEIIKNPIVEIKRDYEIKNKENDFILKDYKKEYIIRIEEKNEKYLEACEDEIKNKKLKSKKKSKEDKLFELYDYVYILISKKTRYAWIQSDLKSIIIRNNYYEKLITSDEIDVINIKKIENKLNFKNIEMHKDYNGKGIRQANLNDISEKVIIEGNALGFEYYWTQLQANKERAYKDDTRVHVNDKIYYLEQSDFFEINNKDLYAIKDDEYIKLDENKRVRLKLEGESNEYLIPNTYNNIRYNTKVQMSLIRNKDINGIYFKTEDKYKKAVIYNSLKKIENDKEIFKTYMDKSLVKWTYMGKLYCTNVKNCKNKKGDALSLLDELEFIDGNKEFSISIDGSHHWRTIEQLLRDRILGYSCEHKYRLNKDPELYEINMQEKNKYIEEPLIELEIIERKAKRKVKLENFVIDSFLVKLKKYLKKDEIFINKIMNECTTKDLLNFIELITLSNKPKIETKEHIRKLIEEIKLNRLLEKI